MHPPLDAFFEPAPGGGQRLYLHHMPPPGTEVRGAVLYLHPWGEEMNKSRRMAALASRALAADGWAVLQIDLLGCGDSSGDFGDATWQAWTDDAVRAAKWLQGRHAQVGLWLWGLRSGALLAVSAAQQLDRPVNFLFWQPVLQGRSVLQGFLRLKAAAQLADGGGKAVLQAARAELAAQRPVEVAGYLLSAKLAAGLEQAQLAPPPVKPARLVWFEIAVEAAQGLSPAARDALPSWERGGWAAQGHVVAGPSFWQTTEIEDAPKLVHSTVAVLSESAADYGPGTK